MPQAGTRVRADIQGLRAVAVGLVVAYHAKVAGVPGGYVGVDVFYVISGFLITGLLLREADRTGTVRLAAFYARRARRLLPAATVVILATLAAAFVFLPPLRLAVIGTDAAAAALYVSNLRFAFQATDYLAADSTPEPVPAFLVPRGGGAVLSGVAGADPAGHPPRQPGQEPQCDRRRGGDRGRVRCLAGRLDLADPADVELGVLCQPAAGLRVRCRCPGGRWPSPGWPAWAGCPALP